MGLKLFLGNSDSAVDLVLCLLNKTLTLGLGLFQNFDFLLLGSALSASHEFFHLGFQFGDAPFQGGLHALHVISLLLGIGKVLGDLIGASIQETANGWARELNERPPKHHKVGG